MPRTCCATGICGWRWKWRTIGTTTCMQSRSFLRMESSVFLSRGFGGKSSPPNPSRPQRMQYLPSFHFI
uniref:Uncharacterized protein n=1 Tax=Nannochloropsis gaditana (strain CCMP526) TaxID=1093141 RepID=I2CRN4_NANGC